MMKTVLAKTDMYTLEAEAIVLGVYAFEKITDPRLKRIDTAGKGLLKQACAAESFTGAAGKSLLLHRPAGMAAPHLVLVGLGEADKASTESARRLGGQAARRFAETALRRIGVVLPEGLGEPEHVAACVEGFLTGPGGVDAYKTEEAKGRQRKRKKKDPYHGDFSELALVLPTKAGTGHREAARRGALLAEGMILARRLVNEPGNRMTPRILAREAKKACIAAGLTVTVFDERQLREKGFGGVLAVSRGSEEPPRFVVMRYRPKNQKAAGRAPLALVGKGITFDSGGISIKPGKGMEEMKADMAGAAAVIGAMTVIGRLGAPRPVIGIVPTCENLPSGSALKPGDVIDTYSGKTIEILNTDAEGRLVLADGLAFAAEQSPEAIVDAATLTGACVVALGHVYAGLMGNDAAWVETVRATAEAWGEKVWPLPMDPEYDDLVESEIADVRNTGKDNPGAITAAKLLEKFVGACTWAHLDIAGVEWRKESKPWIASGPTGFGVRTFTGLALRKE